MPFCAVGVAAPPLARTRLLASSFPPSGAPPRADVPRRRAGCFALLGLKGAFKPCYCESFCRRKAKAGVARQWKMQADKSTAAYASFCTSGFVPRSRGGSRGRGSPRREGEQMEGFIRPGTALTRNESRSFSRRFEGRSRMTHSHFCLHHFLQSTLVGSGGRDSRTAFGLRVG